MADIQTIKLVVDANTANVTINQVHNQIGGLTTDLGVLKTAIEALTAPLMIITGLFAGLGALHIIEGLAETADSYTNVGNRIRQVVTNVNDYNTAMADVNRIANDTRTSLDDTSELYQKVARGVIGVGGSIQQVSVVTEALSQVMQTSGNSTQQLQGAMRQLGDMFNTGQLQGKHFMALMNDAPQVLDVVARSLGVPVSKLHELATQGELTGKVLIDAFTKAAPEIARQFDALPMTFSGALQTLSNNWEVFVGKFSQESGLGAYAQAFIKVVSDMVMGVGDNTLQYAKTVGTSIITVFNNTLLGMASIADLISNTASKMKGVWDIATTTPATLIAQAFGYKGVTDLLQQVGVIPKDKTILGLITGVSESTAIYDQMKAFVDKVNALSQSNQAKVDGTNPLSFGGSKIPEVVPQIDEKQFKQYENQLASILKQFDPLNAATIEFNKRNNELNTIMNASQPMLDKLGVTKQQLAKYSKELSDAYDREQHFMLAYMEPLQRQTQAMDVDVNHRKAYLDTINLESQLKLKNIDVTQQQLDQYQQVIQRLQELQKIDAFKTNMKDLDNTLNQQVATYGLIGNEQAKAQAIAQLRWNAEKEGITEVNPLIDQYAAKWDAAQQTMRNASTATLGFKQSVYDYAQKALDVASTTKQAMDGVFSSLESSLANFFATGKFGMSDFVKTLNQQLSQIAARNLIGAVIGAFGGGTTSLPTRAVGGAVEAGQSYIVNEQGREIFTPGTNGSILTNSQAQQMYSGGTSNNSGVGTLSFGDIVIHNTGGALNDPQTVKYLVTAIHDKVMTSVISETGYGGAFRTKG